MYYALWVKLIGEMWSPPGTHEYMDFVENFQTLEMAMNAVEGEWKVTPNHWVNGDFKIISMDNTHET